MIPTPLDREWCAIAARFPSEVYWRDVGGVLRVSLSPRGKERRRRLQRGKITPTALRERRYFRQEQGR